LPCGLACLFSALEPCAVAATDAIVPDATTTGSGYVNGAVGFSFIPTVDLSVTRVGYLDNTFANPIVSFWSDTGSVLSSHAFSSGTGSGLMVYDAFSFSLSAGTEYSIVLQDGPLSSSTVTFSLFEAGGSGPPFGLGDFSVASELTGYAVQSFDSTGALISESPDFYDQGPNFSFVVVPEPESMAMMTLAVIAFLSRRVLGTSQA